MTDFKTVEIADSPCKRHKTYTPDDSSQLLFTCTLCLLEERDELVVMLRTLRLDDQQNRSWRDKFEAEAKQQRVWLDNYAEIEKQLGIDAEDGATLSAFKVVIENAAYEAKEQAETERDELIRKITSALILEDCGDPQRGYRMLAKAIELVKP